jgi:hypothetical protein
MIKKIKIFKEIRYCDNPNCGKKCENTFYQYITNTIYGQKTIWDYCSMECMLKHLNYLFGEDYVKPYAGR